MDGTSLRKCFIVSFLKQEKRRAITWVRDGEIETELSDKDNDAASLTSKIENHTFDCPFRK